ncbi:MAG: PAS domain S-box protein [Pseudomonadota bacterium]
MPPNGIALSDHEFAEGTTMDDLAADGPEGLPDPIEKTILRSMNEGVMTLECNGDIHTINPAALRILGFGEAELKGEKFGSVFEGDPENEHFVGIVLDVITRDILTTRTETVFKRRDGRKVDLTVATSYLAVDECEPGRENVVMVFRDITPFKTLEKARRRAVDHLSHELKTPLAVIEASVAGLKRNEGIKPENARAFKRIERNLQRLIDIQQIVEQIVSPKKWEPEKVDPSQLIAGILQRLEPLYSHRAVHVKPAFADVGSAMLDPGLVKTVVDTLVKNAIENTPDGGSVTVSIDRAPEGLLLKVEDTGVGIRPSDKDFLFEGFHHTQETDEYSTKKPFDFNAGGKGLELLRLKVLSESGLFSISFAGRRCGHIPGDRDQCPGVIAGCPHVDGPNECAKTGGTIFSVLFPQVSDL